MHPLLAGRLASLGQRASFLFDPVAALVVVIDVLKPVTPIGRGDPPGEECSTLERDPSNYIAVLVVT